MLVWAKIKGTQVMWPGKIISKGQFAVDVYIHSDDSVFTVKLSDILPFHENVPKLRQPAIDKLLKKGKLHTLQCFMNDVQWALDEGLVNTNAGDKDKLHSDILDSLVKDDNDDLIIEKRDKGPKNSEGLTSGMKDKDKLHSDILDSLENDDIDDMIIEKRDKGLENTNADDNGELRDKDELLVNYDITETNESLEDILQIDEIISASESEEDDDDEGGRNCLSKMLKNWSKFEDKISKSSDKGVAVSRSVSIDVENQGTQETKCKISQDVVSDKEEEIVDVVTDGSEIMRDSLNPNIYIRRVLKSMVKNRVYNSAHSCFFCQKHVLHIRPHLKAKHCHIKEVEDAFSACAAGNEKPLELLRAKGDDLNNRRVIDNGSGELLLFRRPSKKLEASEYGPCPNCYEWISKNNIKRHQIRCMGVDNALGVQSKRNLLLQSDIACGRFKSNASDLLRKEVFSIMTVDSITDIAQNDVLIVALGECWLRQNIDNPLKRAHYSSQRMRLASRLLVELRKLDTGHEKKLSMWDFIKPEFFDIMAQAALEVAIPMFDDEDELKSPSNCLKLKYDILRLTNFKWSFVVKSSEQNNKERKDCKTFLHLMSLEFKTKVTKLAYTVLTKRQFSKRKEIPTPTDIELLNKHLVSELSTCSLHDSKENFFHVVKFLQCRLLSYNKRRSGEIDAISLKSFMSRRKDLSDVDQSLVGELSVLERHLLESQDLMIVRGKRGKPVPVIIPDDCRKPLEFIVNADSRQKAGVNKDNRYLFPNSVNGATRSYGSLKSICSDLNLKNPENITSVTMRKYTATLSQVMDLNNNQMDWLCKHLGHTKRVHKDHYQQMSGFIERVKISKLLLVQDLNLTKKFAGKKLDDISLEDVIMDVPGDVSEIDNIENNGQKRSITESVTVSESESEPEIKKRRKSGAKRIRWTSDQVAELKRFFKHHFDKKTTPGKNECMKVLEKSAILKMKQYTDIVKKISNLNHK